MFTFASDGDRYVVSTAVYLFAFCEQDNSESYEWIPIKFEGMDRIRNAK